MTSTASGARVPLPNPYTPGQVPRFLAGRREELGRIRDQVGRVATYGETGGPLLVFHAPRGLGKTSLLRAAQRETAELGVVSVWVSCVRGTPVLPELVAGVARSLERAEVTAGATSGAEGTRWRARLDRIGVELGVVGLAGVRVSADLRDDEPQDPSPTAPVTALEDLLHDAATLVRRRGGAGLLVLVDELHAAQRGELSLLLNALQNLDGQREDNPLAVVTAGLPVTPEAITRAATFGERSAFVALDLLADADARAAVTGPADALGVSWTVPALDAVVAESGGYPYFLQLLGSAAWAAAAPAAGERIGLADVRAGVPAAQGQITAMYRARWGSATPGEQAFLAAMAASVPDEGNVSRAQIAAALGQDSRAISVPRERLIDKGVIEPVGHGLVRFTLPGFAAFVRRRGEP
ncbi:ATP-binding protein [Nocardioides bigeumensis]|uniref:ATP-binding protein n=1 Tax=Nocardioides bigeumensis TaxID=433657 RepID=A0ABP5KIG0_9ACTN